jgi:hypothetical protein
MSKGVPPARADTDSGASSGAPSGAVQQPIPDTVPDDEDVAMDDGDDGEETPRKSRITKRPKIMSPTSEKEAPPAQRQRRMSNPTNKVCTT